MAGPLGCETHRVFAVERGSGRQVCELRDTLDVSWTRRLDETSEAIVTVGTAGSPDCCRCVEDLRSWGHELEIWRGSEQVWTGPIVHLSFTVDAVVITARDLSAWLDKRVRHTDLDLTGNPTDLALIAENVIRDALEPDDPNVLPFLDVEPAGVTGERAYVTDGTQAGEDLRELADSGVDWTVFGRSIIVRGEASFGFAGTLRDEHFVDGIEIVEDGLDLCTRTVVLGDGVTGIAGGPDPYYGLVECIDTSDTILDQTSADEAARAQRAVKYPTPLSVQVPDGAALAPDTPLGINDLVPGTMVTVLSSATCRQVAGALRLTSVDVFEDTAGESVRVSLFPLNEDG